MLCAAVVTVVAVSVAPAADAATGSSTTGSSTSGSSTAGSSSAVSGDRNGVFHSRPGWDNDQSRAKAKDADALTKRRQAGDVSMFSGYDTSLDFELTYQIQQYNEWCVPASVRTTLSAFGSLPSQSTLANQMGTSMTNGTDITHAPPIMNGYESRNNYVANTNTSGAADLFSRVQVDINSPYDAPLIPGIQASFLPIWQLYGKRGAHAVVLFGYYSDGATVNYWDPINDSRMNGRLTTNVSNIAIGMYQDGNYLVW